MTSLDWSIVAAFLLTLLLVAIRASRLSRSVAHYMVANRSAGRYLLTAASAMSMLGAIQVIQEFQRSYEAGFAAMWWNQLLAPVGLAVALSGWIVYRWRSTRILTQAQLFEARYSSSYRIFAGILAFVGGVAGLGIFPGVAARFFGAYLGLPQTVLLFGLELATYQVLLVSLITLATFFTFIGGQIVIILTDAMQAIFTFVVVTALILFFLVQFGWDAIMQGLAQTPPGESKINPYDTSGVQNYNMWFYLIMVFNMIFIWPAGGWNQAANSSGLNPHETRMANVLARVREIVVYTPLILIPIFVFGMMQLAEYSEVKVAVDLALQGETIQNQRELTVPLALAHILPIGLLGAFAAMMLAAYVSTDNSYYLQFGGMFIQDILLPFRKTPFAPKTHLILLRCSAILVAVMVYLFSSFFVQMQDISMYFALIWSSVGGGIYIPFLGALYWKKATTIGCWASALTGILLSILAFGLERKEVVVDDHWSLDDDGAIAWNEHRLYFRNQGHEISAGSAQADVVAWSTLENRYRGAATFEEIIASDPDARLIASKEDGQLSLHRSAFWHALTDFLSFIPGVFEQTGAQRGFFITLLSACVFIFISLLDRTLRRRPDFNLDQLLKRGPYAIAGERQEDNELRPGRLNRILNITKGFTRGDRALYYALILWAVLGLALFLIGTLWSIQGTDTDAGWMAYWHVYTITICLIAIAGSAFLIRGALKDIRAMWNRLRDSSTDDSDNGTVN